jgi:hypothetical protein
MVVKVKAVNGLKSNPRCSGHVQAEELLPWYREAHARMMSKASASKGRSYQRTQSVRNESKSKSPRMSCCVVALRVGASKSHRLSKPSSSWYYYFVLVFLDWVLAAPPAPSGLPEGGPPEGEPAAPPPGPAPANILCLILFRLVSVKGIVLARKSS